MSAADAAKEDAAAGDEKNTTATQRDTDREDGRTHKNEAPAAQAAEATTPGTGAGHPTAETAARQDREAGGKAKLADETIGLNPKND